MNRKLDINAFLQNKKNSVWEYEDDKFTYSIKATVQSHFLEIVTEKGTTLQTKYSYFKDGKLDGYTHFYCGVEVGISRHYNVDGDLVSEENLDEPYKFSMDDLRELLLKMFHIDILRSSHVGTRAIQIYKIYLKGLYKPRYELYIPIPNWSGQQLIIDGNTGEIISHINEDAKELIDEKSKDKNKNKPDSLLGKHDERHWTPLID